MVTCWSTLELVLQVADIRQRECLGPLRLVPGYELSDHSSQELRSYVADRFSIEPPAWVAWRQRREEHASEICGRTNEITRPLIQRGNGLTLPRLGSPELPHIGNAPLH